MENAINDLTTAVIILGLACFGCLLVIALDLKDWISKF